ncbi:MAG: hypothetical protein ACD_79C01535G0014 [uncultured bacterium]|nr:MAG: hypothetical protein ACD_79C01535G0014 [uncultured bacterium]
MTENFKISIAWLALNIFFLFLFYITQGNKPLIQGEIVTGTLSNHPNIVTEYKNYIDVIPLSYIKKEILFGFKRSFYEPMLSFYFGNYRIPLMYQQREGGFFYILEKFSSDVFGPLKGITILQFIFSSFIILIFGFLLLKLDGLTLSYIGMFLISFDAIQICAHFYTAISILPSKFMLLLGTAFLSRKTRFSALISGIFIAFSFYLRVSALWHFIFLIILFYNKRNIILITSFLTGFIPVFLIHISFINWNIFFHEISQSSLFRYPFVDLYNIIANKNILLSFLSNSSYLEMEKGNSLKLFQINPLGLISILCFLSPIFINHFIKTNIFNKKFYLSMYSGLIIFFLFMWITTKGEEIHSRYLMEANWFIILILSFIYKDLLIFFQKKFNPVKSHILVFFIIGLPHILQTTSWITDLNKKGFVLQSDARFLKEITKDFLKTESDFLYTVQFNDIGTFEYLTSEKITPYHFYYSITNSKKDIHDSIVDIATSRKKGTFLISIDTIPDFTAFKINIEYLKSLLKINNIVITKEKLYSKNGKPGFWTFSFKKI